MSGAVTVQEEDRQAGPFGLDDRVAWPAEGRVELVPVALGALGHRGAESGTADQSNLDVTAAHAPKRYERSSERAKGKAASGICEIRAHQIDPARDGKFQVRAEILDAQKIGDAL